MAIQKASGGVEDLLFGMGTVQQERKGQVVVITEINGTKIPYNATLTINERIDQVDSQVDPIRQDLDNHKADSTNPHNVTAAQTGAEPYLGVPSVSGAILGSDSLGNRQWLSISGFVVEWGDIQGDIKQQTDLMNELDKKVNNYGGDDLVGIYEVEGSIIISDYLASNYLYTKTNIFAEGEIRCLNSLGTGTNPNGNSAIQFNVTSSGVGPGVLFFDNTDGEFKVDVTSAEEGYTLWHSGNYTPDVIEYVQGDIGTSYIPDLSNITAFFLNVTEDNSVIENPTNKQAGQSGKFIIGQDDVGHAGLTWGTDYLFETGGDNTMPTDPHAQMIISFVVRGGVLLCTIESKFGAIPVDTTPPVITILGANPLDHPINTTYVDPGATAIDDVDGDITSQIIVVNNVDETTEGTYTVTYNVSDMAGNPAQEQVRTVNVITPSTIGQPIYNLTETLVDNGGYKWLVDDTGEYNARLEKIADGTPFIPSSAEYPEDGTLELGTENQADTQWIVPEREQTIVGIYDVNMGTSYQMYAIHYKGSGVADIYLGDNNTPIALSESDKVYTLPTESWKLLETPPDIITPPGPDETIVYINFDDESNTPPSVTVNQIATLDLSDAPSDYLDSNGNATGISTANADTFDSWYEAETAHGSCFHTDTEFCVRGIGNSDSGVTKGFDIVLPEGIWEITLLSSINAGDSAARTGTFTIDSVSKDIDASIDNTGSHCATWTDISGDRTISVDCENSDGGAYITALEVRK